MAVQAITKEGRESLSVLTAELKKGLPALEAELMATTWPQSVAQGTSEKMLP